MRFDDAPLGLLRAEPYGPAGQQVTLTVAPALLENLPRFFYYSGGSIRPLVVPPRRMLADRGNH